MFQKKRAGVFNSTEAVEETIRRAVDLRASDIHFEPFADIYRVRLRIDGALMKYSVLPLEKKEEISAVIKVMAAMDSTSNRKAQDGKIAFGHPEGPVEIRVSAMPVRHGEKIVLRILRRDRHEFPIDRLGINRECLPLFRGVLSGRQGLLLITGPTGSGKTTTIYSALGYIESDELNIVTVEDPIEYEMPGINQIELSRSMVMGYADILRAVLRQDPDVLVIGEIRDPETARVAVRAALTGHLVIASLHTNDAIDTVVRLSEMGIESYLLAAALRLIVAQRLIRLLCPRCKREEAPGPEHAAIFGLSSGATVHGPEGCPHCSGTGYFGRRSVFEFLPVDDEVIEILAKNDRSHELKHALRGRRESVLFQEARRAILAGETSCEEVVRKIDCQ